MVHDNKQAKELEAVREALTSWRRRHGGRGRPIPASLWSEAADVARVSGVAETARALRLDATRLAKLVGGGAEIAPRRVEQPPTFVEVGGLELGEPRRVAVVELVGREGDRVRVEVVGGAGSAVDLVALARAFWGRSA
jgi:hypothetical protein